MRNEIFRSQSFSSSKEYLPLWVKLMRATHRKERTTKRRNAQIHTYLQGLQQIARLLVVGQVALPRRALHAVPLGHVLADVRVLPVGHRVPDQARRLGGGVQHGQEGAAVHLGFVDGLFYGVEQFPGQRVNALVAQADDEARRWREAPCMEEKGKEVGREERGSVEGHWSHDDHTIAISKRGSAVDFQ